MVSGAIAEDIAIYAESVRKLAQTVTAGPEGCCSRKTSGLRQRGRHRRGGSEFDNYTQSVCGRPSSPVRWLTRHNRGLAIPENEMR